MEQRMTINLLQNNTKITECMRKTSQTLEVKKKIISYIAHYKNCFDDYTC